MAASSTSAHGHGDPTRRDFLMVATGALGAVGAAAVAWPFINNLNPAADTLALSTIEVNVTPNRSDALSHLGIAREVAAATGAALAAGFAPLFAAAFCAANHAASSAAARRFFSK